MQRSASQQTHSSEDDYSDDEFTHTDDVTNNGGDTQAGAHKQDAIGINSLDDTADTTQDSSPVLNGHHRRDNEQEVRQTHIDQSEDSLHFTYSTSSLENNNHSEESLSTISRSSPVSSKNSSTTTIHEQSREAFLPREEAEDEVDWGRSNVQQGDRKQLLQEEQGKRQEPNQSQKQTTPTTPKTPPHVPELLKKVN